MADVIVNSEDLYQIVNILRELDVTDRVHQAFQREGYKRNPKLATDYLMATGPYKAQAHKIVDPDYEDALTALRSGNEVREFLAILAEKVRIRSR